MLKPLKNTVNSNFSYLRPMKTMIPMDGIFDDKPEDKPDDKELTKAVEKLLEESKVEDEEENNNAPLS